MLQEETESRGWRNWTGGGVGLLGAGAGGGLEEETARTVEGDFCAWLKGSLAHRKKADCSACATAVCLFRMARMYLDLQHACSYLSHLCAVDS